MTFKEYIMPNRTNAVENKFEKFFVNKLKNSDYRFSVGLMKVENNPQMYVALYDDRDDAPDDEPLFEIRFDYNGETPGVVFKKEVKPELDRIVGM